MCEEGYFLDADFKCYACDTLPNCTYCS